jgi:hypothetical protein
MQHSLSILISNLKSFEKKSSIDKWVQKILSTKNSHNFPHQISNCPPLITYILGGQFCIFCACYRWGTPSNWSKCQMYNNNENWSYFVSDILTHWTALHPRLQSWALFNEISDVHVTIH